MTYPEVFPHDFKPGLTIPVRSFADLRAFEDELVNVVDEDYDMRLWDTRTPLTNLLRPLHFQGNLEGVTLTVMDEPFEQFLAAQAAARRQPAQTQFNRGDGKPANPRRNYLQDLCAPLMKSFVGFHFLAQASSGNVPLGPVSADFWFGPAVRNKKGRELYAGEAVVRAVTLPSYDVDGFAERLKTSMEKGKHIRQGRGGKSLTRSPRIDPLQ